MTDFVPGAIANKYGDLYGNSPFYAIAHGRVVLEVELADAAEKHGWRIVPKVGECDDDYVWMERLENERRDFSVV